MGFNLQRTVVYFSISGIIFQIVLILFKSLISDISIIKSHFFPCQEKNESAAIIWQKIYAKDYKNISLRKRTVFDLFQGTFRESSDLCEFKLYCLILERSMSLLISIIFAAWLLLPPVNLSAFSIRLRSRRLEAFLIENVSSGAK